MVVSTNVKGDDVNLTVWWCVLQGHLTNIRTTKVDSHQGNYSKNCHEGGGSRVPLTFNLFLLKNHLESPPDSQNAFCT